MVTEAAFYLALSSLFGTILSAVHRSPESRRTRSRWYDDALGVAPQFQLSRGHPLGRPPLAPGIGFNYSLDQIAGAPIASRAVIHDAILAAPSFFVVSPIRGDVMDRGFGDFGHLSSP